MMRPLNTRRWLKALKWVLLLLLAIISLWLAMVLSQLHRHAQQPADAVLVLGGSIRREMYMADSVANGMNVPILISKGAQPPCTRILFERVSAPLTNVWLETCAQSTFDNYRYSVPVLTQWGSQHVQVVTSATHLPRAKWLAMIILGSHGIWVDMMLVDEIGVPGNVETPIKMTLDVVRSLLWAVVSQFYFPSCDQIFPLESVDLEAWQEKGFRCEHQADIEL
ncbi:MAG: YdcF family protein [Merismopedia sp. SIO2A8]|nr:YdcF family protein [Symploca sp. SIO2B6]NET51425.1 YdcF family protein [Merismopedia sp. SIO2A8]